MLDLNDVRLFLEVAARGGFSAAARALQIPTSTISHRVKQLEAALGVTLLLRTSRSITLTDAGEELYHDARDIIERANQAESAMRGRATEPKGTVRYSCSVAMAQYALPPIISDFLVKHPKIDLHEFVENNFVDIVAEGYDLAVRAHTGALANSALVQRALVDVPWGLFASPEYFKHHDEPSSPSELVGHETMLVRRQNVTPSWTLTHRDSAQPDQTVPIQPRLSAASMTTLKSAAQAGAGIVALPVYLCRAEVDAAVLQRVLPDWTAARSTISVITPHRRGMSAAVRAFIEHLFAHLPDAVRLG